jgi:uncharacterized protein YecT (DUF1311 family)
VFEFGQKGPACVPCKEADSQAALNICADAAALAADRDVTSEYRSLRALLPEDAKRLAAAEKAWRTFRAQFCAWESSLYEGGSVQPEIRADCEARESRVHLERLKSLTSEWSKRIVPPQKRKAAAAGQHGGAPDGRSPVAPARK